jgi:WD40 repeat protein/DNA-binding SARP family transcriptional activator
MAYLVLSFFGGFQVTRNNHPLTRFESNKGRALLAYLAVEADRPYRRESLAALLWPEFSEQAALTNLRVALSDLRTQLHDRDVDPPYLLVSRDTIQFNRASDAWVDVWEFEKGASKDIRNGDEQSAIENQKSAIALFRGPFLAGFSIPDSFTFEEWLTLKREQLTQQAIHTLRQLADFYETCGDYEPALTYAHRQVELEPWLEEAHRQIMRLLALSGECSSALVQYETCKRTLAEELAIEPSLETTRLYDTIYAGQIEDIRLNEPLPIPGEPPFKGLQFFDEPDSTIFFGREMLTQRILSQVQVMVGSVAPTPFFTVIGASGSGKSSLVRAGLVPALRRDGYDVQVITPGPNPSTHPLGGNGILVIDQFEELFTLCHNEPQRAAFLDSLFSGIRDILIVLRADFYAHCAQYPRLRETLCARQEYIGPMDAAELRRAIEEPACQNGWDFEPGLVELILRDVGVSEGNPPEPGALPLLEHALLETWKRRRGRTLTLKGYAEAGGVRGAIAHTAESMLLQLSADDQALVRRIFLRLTALGEGSGDGFASHDTRRRVSRSELATDVDETAPLDTLLRKLAEARLITLSAENAEVAHEALIREWPTLRQWLSEDRDALRLHRHITESALAWERLGRDPGELYRGARLAQALEWAQDHTKDLNTLERDYLLISQQLAEAELIEREQQRQRELETALRFAESAQKLAETERQRATEQAQNAKRLRQRAWALTGALGLALLLIIATVWLAGVANANAKKAQTNAQQANAEANTRATAESVALAQQGTAEAERARADEQKNAALSAQATAESERVRAEGAQAEAEAQRLNAVQQAAINFARELASNSSLNLEKDSQLSLLLALRAIEVVQAVGIDPIPWDVQQALHNVIIQSRLIYSVYDEHGSWYALYSPDGKWIAVEKDQPTSDSGVFSITTSIRDAATGKEQVSYGGYPTDFSPDGKWLSVSEWENLGIESVKDVLTGQRLITITGVIGTRGGFTGVTFSPDGNWLAWGGGGYADTNGMGDEPRLWDITAWRKAGAQPGLTLTISDSLHTTDGGCTTMYAPISFSPDGQRMASSCGGDHFVQQIVKVWDVSTRQLLWESPVQSHWIFMVDFSPDGSRLVSGDYNGNAFVWDAATGEQLMSLKDFTGYIQAIAYSPDGSLIAAVGDDVMVWDAYTGKVAMKITDRNATGMDFSPDGSRLVVTGSSVEMWDVTPLARGELAQKPALPTGYDYKVSPDLSQWIVSRTDGMVEFIRSDTLETLAEMRVYTPTSEIQFTSMLNHDNTLLATAGNDTIAIWDMVTQQKKMDLQASGPVYFAVFNPDSTLLVSGGSYGEVTIWDLATGKKLHTLPIPLAEVFWAQFSPDGTRLVVSGWMDPQYAMDGRLLIWDLTPGSAQLADPIEIKASGRLVLSFSFSPDGQSLLTSAQEGVKVYDMNTYQPRFTIWQTNGGSSMSMYSPDGQYIVSGWDNGLTRVFDSQTGIELLSYPSPGSFKDWGVSFTPDGQRIISLGTDGFQQFAFLNFDDLITIARTRLIRTWNDQECRQYLHRETCP